MSHLPASAAARRADLCPPVCVVKLPPRSPEGDLEPSELLVVDAGRGMPPFSMSGLAFAPNSTSNLVISRLQWTAARYSTLTRLGTASTEAPTLRRDFILPIFPSFRISKFGTPLVVRLGFAPRCSKSSTMGGRFPYWSSVVKTVFLGPEASGFAPQSSRPLILR